MNPNEKALAQIDALAELENWLEMNPDYREKINAAIYSTANASGFHPHDLAIYILIRTS